MGQALYRKYRSKSLGEIVGQEHITDTLRQALKSGRISHAYLFTGPRGVGKTSIARILAHEINGLPYAEGQTNLDIIEIDAASNRRIDEIRDLRDKVYIAPAQAKYKVYIIDEVHMLTKEAFNALLKTLEEPPAHAVFILATTEAHKLPETIISRTQRFIFKPIDPAAAVKHLRDIASKEKIDVTDDALALIAEHGDGSFRDSISLLDQASSHGKNIDLAAVQTMLGIPTQQAIDDVVALIQASDTTVNQLFSALVQLYDQGFQATMLAKQLAIAIRAHMMNQTLAMPISDATILLARLLDVPGSRDPERYLEIVLLESLQAKPTTPAPAVHVQIVEPKPKPAATHAAPAPKTAVVAPASKPKEKPVELRKERETAAEPTTPTTLRQVKNGTAALDDESWQEVLSILKQNNNTLYGVARMARPDFSEPGKLTLAFAFAFHQKRLHEAKNQQVVSDAVTTVVGEQIEIICVHDASLKSDTPKPATAAPTPASATQPTEDAPLSAISNIFGGGELLQYDNPTES